MKANGADEVMIACRDQTFSAMKEYDEKEIVSFIPEGHAMGLKVSVLMNRLYDQKEIFNAQAIMKDFLFHDIDYIYFADPGLLNEAVQIHQENRMIYEPETLVTSSQDASFWMEQGLGSTVISPLITENEILHITQNVAHTSLMIHGRQMMSVSRRHLLQAYADASDKKVSYAYNEHLSLREDKRNGYMPVFENKYGTIIYTDFIQESFDEMDAFMNNGVERFVIEDVFLPCDALLDAIKAYRSILNGKNAEMIGKEYRKRYSDLPLSNGYYGQKTIR